MKRYFLLSLICVILLTACSQNSISGPNTPGPSSASQSQQSNNTATTDAGSDQPNGTQHTVSAPSVQMGDESPADTSQEQNAEESENSNAPTQQTGYAPLLSYSDVGFDHTGIYDLVDNTVYSIDLNNDGTSEQLSLVNTTHDDVVILYGKNVTVQHVGNVTLVISSKEYNEMMIQYGLYAYLLKNGNGNIGLIVCGELPDDNYLFYIYRFENGEPVLSDEGYLKLSDLTMDTFKQSGTIYLFGNHSASIHCALNDDFTYEYLDEGYYELAPQPLRTKIDIMADIYVNGEFMQTIIPSGETLVPTRISPEGCMYFELGDGREGKLNFIIKNNGCYVDGKHEEDIFEGIHYAGGW